VTIASAGIVQQALNLGLVAEVCISLVPVLFGESTPTSRSCTEGISCSTTPSSPKDAAPST
jgi:hypothetical protein